MEGKMHKDFGHLMDKIHAYRGSPNRPDMQPDIAWAIFDVYKKLTAFTGSYKS